MRGARGIWLVLAFAVLGCRRESNTDEAAASASAVSAARAAAPAPSASAPKPKAWYEGRWSGKYEASLERITLEVGGVRAWKDDDGTSASGPGTITLDVTADGVVTGESDGALGPASIRGVADDAGFRLTFAARSDDPRAFNGTLVTERGEGRVSGTLRASSGDSLTVRKAQVELTPNAPTP